MIALLAGTMSSSGPSGRRSTARSASSGSSRSTGSSSRSLHSSRQIIVAAAVIGLVNEERRKIVSPRIGVPSGWAAPIGSMSASPRRHTASTSPGTSPRST